MQDLIAQEILKILMESGIFREESTALEVLESAPKSWIAELEESASFVAISSLQESLEEAVANKDFESAKIIKEKIAQLSQS
jgi:protein-arginine kinase activator protein McsA